MDMRTGSPATVAVSWPQLQDAMRLAIRLPRRVVCCRLTDQRSAAGADLAPRLKHQKTLHGTTPIEAEAKPVSCNRLLDGATNEGQWARQVSTIAPCGAGGSLVHCFGASEN